MNTSKETLNRWDSKEKNLNENINIRLQFQSKSVIGNYPQLNKKIGPNIVSAKNNQYHLSIKNESD